MKAQKLLLLGLILSLSLVSCGSIDAFVPNEIVGEIDGLSVQNGVEATFASNPLYLGDGTSRHFGDDGSKLVTFGLSYRILREQSITKDIHFKLFPGFFAMPEAVFPTDIEYYCLAIGAGPTMPGSPLLVINDFPGDNYNLGLTNHDERFTFPRYFNIYISFDILVSRSSPLFITTERVFYFSLYARNAGVDSRMFLASVSVCFSFGNEWVTFISDCCIVA